MGYSGKVLELDQMRTLIQTTLAIQIMYYILVTCIKISICFCYLRIGKFTSGFHLDKITNDALSCRQTVRSTVQRHHLLPGSLLPHLCHRLFDAMHPAPRNVEFHRCPTRNMHQHHSAVLQYVIVTIKARISLTPNSNQLHPHHRRHLDHRPARQDPPQNPTPRPRKVRPHLRLRPRRLLHNRLHRPPPLHPHLHRIDRSLLRLRPRKPLVPYRSQHRHLVRLDPRPQSHRHTPPRRKHGLTLSRHLPVP